MLLSTNVVNSKNQYLGHTFMLDVIQRIHIWLNIASQIAKYIFFLCKTQDFKQHLKKIMYHWFFQIAQRASSLSNSQNIQRGD